MRGYNNVIITIVTVLLFWLTKFYFNFPNGDIAVVGVILTIASVLFGFLAGFFISELWTRYTEIRSLQGTSTATLLNILNYSEKFFQRNGLYKREFMLALEKSLIATAVADWTQGELLIPYSQKLGRAFKRIKLTTKEDEYFLQEILSNYSSYIEAQIKLDMLGKERLFRTEWIIMLALSLTLGACILFLDISSIYFQIIALAFPAIIVLALNIIHDLDNMTWSMDTVSLEPNERIFDMIGKKRFYLTTQITHITRKITNYRTEKDLEGVLKKVYQEIVANRS